MSGTLRGVLMLIVVIACGGAWLPSTLAQQRDVGDDTPGAAAPETPSARDAPSFSVSFGVGDSNVIWPGRWGPVTLTLTCGSRPFSGLISVDFFQDGKPGGLIRRPVSCTPGKATTIPVMLNPGRGCRRIGVTLMDQSGRQVQRDVFDMYPNFGSAQSAMPPLTDTSSAVVLGVGEPTGAARSIVQAVSQTRGTSAFASMSIQPVGVDVSRLPTAWTGYDSLLLLAVDSESLAQADPRAVAAIREWVSGGGRLVLFVDQPGTAWREWAGGAAAPGTDAESFFEVGDPAVGPLPAALADEVREPLKQLAPDRAKALGLLDLEADTDADAPGAVGPAGGALVTEDALPEPPTSRERRAPTRATPPELLPAVPRRLIGLTHAGARAGWKVRWAGSVPPAQATAGQERGILAEGPYGFGWIVVVGANPNQLTATSSPDAICAMWTRLTDQALLDWKSRPPTSSPSNPFVVQPDPSLAGGGADVGQAKSNAMERLAQVPIIGDGVFYALAAALFVLALFLGPIDSLVLRRLRARHWSWATSLMWIALASVAALYIPNLLRNGPTQVNRVSVIDVLASARVGGVGPAAPLAWRTSYTGVYASNTARREFAQDSPGAWWRSVSAETFMSYNRGGREQRSAAVTAAVQLLPDFDALDASDRWAGMNLRPGRADGNRLTPAVYKIWTFRTFMDQARAKPPIDAALTPGPGASAGEWALRLSGIPASARVQSAAVKIRGSWHTVEFPPDSPGAQGPENSSRIGAVRRAAGTNELEQTWFSDGASQVSKPVYYGYSGVRGAAEALKHPGQLLSLPGPDRRGMVIDRCFGDAATSSEWAVAYLQLSGMPSDIAFGDDTRYAHDVVLRILIHIGPSGQQTPVPAGPGGTDQHDAGEPTDRRGTGATP